MEEARMLMIEEIPRLRNEVLKWKNVAENKEQEMKTAVATVNKFGQFMITWFLIQNFNFKLNFIKPNFIKCFGNIITFR